MKLKHMKQIIRYVMQVELGKLGRFDWVHNSALKSRIGNYFALAT